LKCEYPWKGTSVRITGWFLIILLLAVLPVFAGNEKAADLKVKEETISIKELKEDSTEKGKSPEPKETIPPSPDPAKAETTPVKDNSSTPSAKISPTPSPEQRKGRTDGIPATTDNSDNSGKGEETPFNNTGSTPTPAKDELLFGREDTGYTGVKLNFPLYIGSILIVSLITIASIKFLGKYMGIPQVGGSKKTMIKILEKQMLGPNKQFCIVEVPGKTVLIGVTETEMKVLCEIDLQSIKSFGESENKPETAGSSSTNYIVDVLLRKWQGGK